MHLLLEIACTFPLALLVRADDQSAAEALIDKAVQAMGGETKLAKLRAATWKAKGTFHSGAKQLRWPTRIQPSCQTGSVSSWI
jgi:hypothetical protein